jgi:ornithine carbamoyltransferase
LTLTVAYVGDSANVLRDMLVTYPRLGHALLIASPPAYRAPAAVWARVRALGIERDIVWSDDPAEAVRGADVVVTETWYAFTFPPPACLFRVEALTARRRISMGQEAEKAERLKAFQGYQVTEALCTNAKPGRMFLHCQFQRYTHSIPINFDASDRIFTTYAHQHVSKGNICMPFQKSEANYRPKPMFESKSN